MKTECLKYDVIIIGAGAAGLMVAKTVSAVFQGQKKLSHPEQKPQNQCSLRLQLSMSFHLRKLASMFRRLYAFQRLEGAFGLHCNSYFYSAHKNPRLQEKVFLVCLINTGKPPALPE